MRCAMNCKTVRDAMLKSNMERGLRQGFDRHEKKLASTTPQIDRR